MNILTDIPPRQIFKSQTEIQTLIGAIHNMSDQILTQQMRFQSQSTNNIDQINLKFEVALTRQSEALKSEMRQQVEDSQKMQKEFQERFENIISEVRAEQTILKEKNLEMSENLNVIREVLLALQK
jgi:flagellar hook-basal body complex protein FliE